MGEGQANAPVLGNNPASATSATVVPIGCIEEVAGAARLFTPLINYRSTAASHQHQTVQLIAHAHVDRRGLVNAPGTVLEALAPKDGAYFVVD